MGKRYAVPIDYYRPTTNTFETRSGVFTRRFTVFNILKALVLPTDLKRDFEYDIAFLAANKDFTTGGVWTKGKAQLIIKYQDWQLTTPPHNDDFIIYLGRKWEILKIAEWAEGQAFEFIIQECKSTQEHYGYATHGLSFTSGGDA